MTQEEHIQQTVEKSITAFWDHEKRQSSSIAEFLYSQFLFIRKRWWMLAPIMAYIEHGIFSSGRTKSNCDHNSCFYSIDIA